MHQIVPHSLWLGNADDGRDFRRIFSRDIKALVHLALEDAPVQPPRELVYCRFPLLDGMGNSPEVLLGAVHTLAALIRLRVPTLVFCGAGRSRSPAIAAAALALVNQQTAEEAVMQLAQSQSCDIHPGFWNEVKQIVSKK